MGMSTFPPLSYVCPKLWTDLHGNEREKFCTVCSRYVVNLSAMTEAERRAVLAQAKAEGKGLCVSYHRQLAGPDPEGDDAPPAPSGRRAAQLGGAVASAAALLLVAQQVPAVSKALDAAQTTAANNYLSLRDETIDSVRTGLASFGRLFGGKPHEPDPPSQMILGMICVPTAPAAAPVPASPPAPASGRAPGTAKS